MNCFSNYIKGLVPLEMACDLLKTSPTDALKEPHLVRTGLTNFFYCAMLQSLSASFSGSNVLDVLQRVRLQAFDPCGLAYKLFALARNESIYETGSSYFSFRNPSVCI